MSTNTTEAYRAASQSAALAELPGRARLTIQGPDRARFLHNLTTQDVKRLPAGEGREAFVTSPQGKTLGHVILLATDDAIELLTTRASLPAIAPHLQKYGIFDDVTIEDVSDATFALHLAGPRAEDVFVGAGGEAPDSGVLRHRATSLGGRRVRVFRESPTGRPGLTILGAAADQDAVASALDAAGSVTRIGADAFEVLRIEGGYPESGRDVTPENLPQEVARDAQAINFVKGCYLGQETVARLDALGHVNKILRGFRLPGAVVPPPGATIEADGKKLGQVTSAAYSPGWDGVISLGYVRTTHANPGTVVSVAGPDGSPIGAVVAELPMLPG